MRIAFFTPLSPLHTALADHSEGLLPHMTELADVDLFIDDGYTPSNPEITSRFSIYNFHEFPGRATRYDAILYAMGDNPTFHGYIYDLLQRFPGVTLLHDTTLHRTMLGLAFQRGQPGMYTQEMRYAYGIDATCIAQQIVAGYGESYIRRYPLFERVVDSSLGVIVYNNYAKRQVLRHCPQARVTQINYHFFLPPGFPDQTDVAALRARWDLEGCLVVGSCGIFVPHKRIDTCLRAFARLRERHPEAVYLFVGNHPPEYDLPGLIHGLGLDDHVILTGWMDPVSFTQHIHLLDIGIHLRYPHIGGTPFSPIRMMGMGIPLLISDIGPLAELPEGTCARVPPDEFEEEIVLALLTYLADDENARRQLGKNGVQWIRENHDARQIAAEHIAAIQQAVIGSSAPRPTDRAAEHRVAYLVREMAGLACAWGIQEQDDDSLRPLAEAIWQQVAREQPGNCKW